MYNDLFRYFLRIKQSNSCAGTFGWRFFVVLLTHSLIFFVAVGAAVAQSTGSMSAPPLQSGTNASAEGLRLNAVRLKIFFDTRLFEAQSEKQRLEQLATFCKVWQEAFLRERGPWGFGIASEVTCEVLATHAALTPALKERFDSWTLTVAKTAESSGDVIQARLCRPHLSPPPSGKLSATQPEQSCEATRSFPWSEFRLRFVRHRAFVRLIVASLLDELPLYSVVSRNLVRADKLAIQGVPEPGTAQVSFPPPPKNLVFVEARIDPQSHRFLLREMSQKDAILLATNSSGTAWIINKEGRGARADEFTKNIDNAFKALSSAFQVDKLKFEKMAVESIANTLLNRTSLNFFVRADGIFAAPLLSQKSGFGGTATLGWRVRSRYVFTLSSNYQNSMYRVATQVFEKDSFGAANGAADVSLSELDGWLSGHVVYPLRFGKWVPVELAGGTRIGYTSGTGDFSAPGGLPEEKLTLRSRSLGLGGSLGVGFPLSSSTRMTSLSMFNYATATRSLSFRSALEWSWIISRIVIPGRSERPPAFQVGVSAGLASLRRRFENNDVSRSYQTVVTLSGIETSAFVEKAF